MKIIRTTFPDGQVISHEGEVKNIQMIISDHKFEVQKQRAKVLKKEADQIIKK